MDRVVSAPAENWSDDMVTLSATDLPTPLAARDTNRRDITIINDEDSLGDVWVKSRQDGRRVGGIRLRPGAGITLTTIAEVFAWSTAAATVYIATTHGSC